MTTKEILGSLAREEGISFFNSKKTDKEVYDILVKKGLTDSFETFVSEAQKVFNEKISTMSKDEIMKQIEGAELTDKELQQIAGGKSEKEEGIAIGAGVGAGAGTVAIVAIFAAL